MKFNTLYSKDSKGKLRVWDIYTEGEKVIIRHGALGGKIVEKITVSQGKNIGKANETSDSKQAELEAEAKWVKQKKTGYFETKEEALDSVEFTPMKAQNYKDQSQKIVYPCYMQPKLNGQRLMIDKENDAWSKQGEVIQVPEHWKVELEVINKILKEQGTAFGLDGEVYAGLESQGGLSLQRIISAFRKPNEDTPKLKYYIYDIPNAEMTFEQRVEILGGIERIIKANEIQNIVVCKTFKVSKEVGDMLYEEFVKQGYEGACYRNAEGVYEFGKRSYDLIKRKPRQTTEAHVYAAEKDKNDEAVYVCELENGVKFKCKMLKEASTEYNLRLWENVDKVVNNWIEIEYEELTDSGVPSKPVGIRLREVDKYARAKD